MVSQLLGLKFSRLIQMVEFPLIKSRKTWDFLHLFHISVQ